MGDDVLFQKLLKVFKETSPSETTKIVGELPAAQQPTGAAAAVLASTNNEMIAILKKLLESPQVGQPAQETAASAALAAGAAGLKTARESIVSGLVKGKTIAASAASASASALKSLWVKENGQSGIIKRLPCLVTRVIEVLAEKGGALAQYLALKIGPALKLGPRTVFHSRLGAVTGGQIELLRQKLSPEAFAEFLKGLGKRSNSRSSPNPTRYLAGLGLPEEGPGTREFTRLGLEGLVGPGPRSINRRTAPNVSLKFGKNGRRGSRGSLIFTGAGRALGAARRLFSRPSSSKQRMAEAQTQTTGLASEAPAAPAAPAAAPENTRFKNLKSKSLEDLVKLRKVPNGPPGSREQVNSLIFEKMNRLVRNSGTYGTSTLKQALRYLRNVPNLPGRDRVMDAIRSRIDEIEYRTRDDPRRALEKLQALRRNLGAGGLFSNSNIRSMFMNAERNYQRRIENERRRRMNENRARRGLEPAPIPVSRNRNRLPPLGNVPTVLRPPPNQPQPNLKPVNLGPLPAPPPMPAPPPLNMGETKALANAGGENKALNLVTNAGGPNNVLKAANQLKEAGNNPNLAIAKGADPKNVRIVLQLGGANNAARVAAATPKLMKRRRRQRRTTKRKSKTARPKVSALKKLIRSLPKKKLLSVLPANNKKTLEGKNKADVATRVTSYLTGRTKKK